MEDEYDEIAEILGGIVGPLKPHPDEMEVFLVTGQIRALLIAATNAAGVSIEELGKRLGVSPAAANVMVRSEGDMRVSTAVLWARALGKTWTMSLSDFGDLDTLTSKITDENRHPEVGGDDEEFEDIFPADKMADLYFGKKTPEE